MAKVAVLVPHAEMCDPARSLLRDYPHIVPMCIEYARTEEIGGRALELACQGCDLIIARGLQARLIKQSVKLPVVEIRTAAQELGSLVLDLKQELQINQPRIGIISFANMLCDTSRFQELFQVELCRYLAGDSDDLEASVNRALEDGCQAVIGGDAVCAKAQALNLPCRFIPSGEETLRDAFGTADRICYAIDLEKSNSAEMNTMLDFTFSGIMQIDSDGTIFRANRVVFNLFNLLPADMIGKNVLEVLPQLTRAVLDKTLKEGAETFASLFLIQQREVVVNVAPILIDGAVTGAVLTFQEGSRIVEMGAELHRELYQRGYIARYTFDRLPFSCEESARLIALARRAAGCGAPILISGEAGCGKGMVAQCIHNEGLSPQNAFIHLDCGAYPSETLDTMLFGHYSTHKDTPVCVAEAAREGTLFLSHVEALSPELQFKLLDLIRGKYLHNGNSRPCAVNIRVIASTTASLSSRVKSGQFRADLYYALSVLTLELPPLRRRREEVLGWVKFYLDDWQAKYQRYINLTQGAKNFLERCDWPGNLDQMNNICQRMVLLTEKRNIDEVFLRRQLEQLTPVTLPETDQVVVFKDERAAKIAGLLRRHGGNRQLVAEELGVSKTTLWRYMKKYGIGEDYSY
ncbi:PAS domain-containing protein [Colidextribacter sp. OB.20]|uniref:sigma 54-interacting transcriptional regulator n=1 Tax=Colidextribacter sp. OB.20 TaxID=2304568 RepID=UPI001367B87A|nr:PAS domain-containing protein [Colidextribacter sp. OB.20]